MEAEGFSFVPKRLRGKSFGQGSLSEVRGSVQNDRARGCPERQFRFGFETERAGFGSRVALHREPGCFSGVEEENVVAL